MMWSRVPPMVCIPHRVPSCPSCLTGLEDALMRVRADAWEAGFYAGHCYGAQQERWSAQGDYADPRDEPSRPRNPWAVIEAKENGK
jgi:hypothetical protein